MGEPKFSRPKYDTPSHPWKADRIEEEHAIQGNHGLKNMKEIWKAKSQLRRHRRQAMRLIGNIDTTEGHGKRERDDSSSPMLTSATFSHSTPKTCSTDGSRPRSTTRDWLAP
jgi:hypothetical protein